MQLFRSVQSQFENQRVFPKHRGFTCVWNHWSLSESCPTQAPTIYSHHSSSYQLSLVSVFYSPTLKTWLFNRTSVPPTSTGLHKVTSRGDRMLFLSVLVILYLRFCELEKIFTQSISMLSKNCIYAFQLCIPGITHLHFYWMYTVQGSWLRVTMLL